MTMTDQEFPRLGTGYRDPRVKIEYHEECPCSMCCVLCTCEHIMVDGQRVEPGRRFVLLRHTDKTGISGTGPVAFGIRFETGAVILNWQGEMSTTVIHKSIDSVIKLHVDGHGQGSNELIWIDP